MTEIPAAHQISSYRNACRQGTDWLLKLLNEDGSIGPAGERLFYYRVPWALAITGEVEAAHRVLDWISQHMFTRDGEFSGVAPRGGFDCRYGSYPLACLVIGATLLQRHDIVYAGAQRLLSWQNAASGGFYHRQEGAESEREEELCPTCQAGMTLLLCGQLAAARRAGEWTKQLWEQQPNVEQELYVCCHSSNGLITDYDEDQAASYVTKKNHPWQHHFNSGIAAAFLTQLYWATGEAEWLALAQKYQAFSMTTDECQFESAQICKSGWGSGLLYVATRDPQYRDWTRRLGNWFVTHQLADGHWENTKYWSPQPTIADNIEITAEFVMHVSNILGYLSVGEMSKVAHATP